MKKENIQELLDRYYAGQASEQDERVLEAWLLDYNSEGELGLSEQDFVQARASMLEGLNRIRFGVKKRSLWPRVAAVAAMLALVIGGLWYYAGKQNTDTAVGTAQILPGRVGATLTLASGKKIRLSDQGSGELARESGVVITKSADGKLTYEIGGSAGQAGQLNTLTTARGETYRVRLPDGSLVWLNAASSLTYPASLRDGGRRWVRLQGEGYFEVAKDKLHPFVVESGGQQVEVLGTHFNINTYADEPQARTTLLEGRVRVALGGNQQNSKILRPGEQAVVLGDGIRVNQVDTEGVVAWKNDYFVFSDEELGSIMRKVSRWYDVEVVFADESLKRESFGGRMPRYSRVEELTGMLEGIGLARFKIEGRRITVGKF